MAKRTVPTSGPFTVYDFKAIGISRASLYRDDDFFMQVETVEGAEAMADILNRAFTLSKRQDLLGSDDPRFAASKVAYAVAKALGGVIDFDSFRADPAEANR